jgi:hypothetical protein
VNKGNILVKNVILKAKVATSTQRFLNPFFVRKTDGYVTLFFISPCKT